MSVLKLFAAGITMCIVVAGARAEDANLAKMLVGKWEITKSAEGAPPAGTMVEFTKDGTVKVMGKMGETEFKMEGKYTVETHKFTCTFKEGDKEKVIVHEDVKIDDKVMTFKGPEGKAIELKRKS